MEFDDYVTFNQDIRINGSTTFMDSNGFTTMNGTLILQNLNVKILRHLVVYAHHQQ